MKEIIEKIRDNFNIEVNTISSFKENYILTNSNGRMSLKKASMSPERILFIHNAKQHLIKNNFNTVDKFILTKNNEPYIKINNNFYTLTKNIDGKEINFDNTDDIINASHLLANLHKCSIGYFTPNGTFSKNELGNLPLTYKKHLNEIKRAKKSALTGRTKFDYLLLEYVDYFYELGSSVIELLHNSNYDELVKIALEEHSFCHHEFTHNNILQKNGVYYLINFDFCCYELKIYDLANLIKRKLRKCNWDINEAKKIIDHYQEISPLSVNEFHVMKLMLMFPQKFWRVINKYYNSKKNLSEKIYISKLNNVIDEIKYIEKFINQYEHLY